MKVKLLKFEIKRNEVNEIVNRYATEGSNIVRLVTVVRGQDVAQRAQEMERFF
jgi:hypothetical protein